MHVHYYKRNIGDYAKKAGRLTMLQHGAYTLLIDSCYDRERFPTLDESFEWTWASTQEEQDAVSFVLRKFFTLGADGLYVQNHIREDIEAYHVNAANNKRIALEREAERRTKRARTVNESPPIEHEAPPNHKPLTINQEPLTKNHKKTVASYDAPDWVPAEQWTSFTQMRKAMKSVPFTEAAAKGVVRELEKLCNEGHDAASLLDTAVMNGWRTVYPPKHAGKVNGHFNKQEALEASNRAVAERFIQKLRGENE